MKKRILIVIGIVILLLITITTTVIVLHPKKTENQEPEKKKEIKKYQENSFNLNLIKTVNSTQNKNYLISPYSIEIALNMLKEGTNTTSKEEFEKVLENRTISKIQVKDRVEKANALFIKDAYKNSIKQSFENTIRTNYQGEVLYDKFTTPEVINNWVKKNTHNMIEKVIDTITPDFVLGLSNAIAIDVEWQNQFQCTNTKEEEFIKENKDKMQVEMMNQLLEENASYFETNNGKGIILPYKSYNEKGEEDYSLDNHLEFIGILPNETVDSYIENLEEKEMEEIDKNKEEANDKLHIKLSLPRFTYDFDLKEFKNVLSTMGISEVFDVKNADLTNIMSREEMNKNNIDNLFVSTAVHKTHIELNETGTKAAAVTYFGVDKNSAIRTQEPRKITITFNKPFVYMIRDKKTKELLFFGVVREPNKWKKSTCE